MPAQFGPNLGLAFGFNQGEGAWKGDIDATMILLDAVAQLSVIDKDLVTAPVGVEGERYIIAGVGGLWSPGTIGDIARFRSGAWEFFTPSTGWIAHVQDETQLYEFVGGVWVIFSSVIDTFLGLTDTPGSFGGAALQFVRVNAGQTALEFATPAGAGDILGPATSTINALVRWADATGGLAADSGWLLDGSDIMDAVDNILRRAQLEDYSETVNTINPVGAAQDVDFELGNIADITLTQNTTLTMINPPASPFSGVMQVILRQNGVGGRTTAFADAITWIGTGGVAPTFPVGIGEVAVFSLQTVDGGTSYLGYFAGASV